MFGPNQKSELFVTKYSSLLTQYVPCGPYGQTRGMRRPVFYRQLWVRNYISHLSLPFRDNPCIQCLVLKSVRRISQRFSEMFSGIKFPSLMNIWNWNWEIFFYVAQIILAVTCYSFAKLWPTLRLRALQHTQAPLSSTISQSLLKFMSIELVMVFNHLTLCQPVLLLPLSHEEMAAHSSIFARRNPWTYRWILITSQMCLVLDCLHHFLLHLEIWFLCFNDVK